MENNKSEIFNNKLLLSKTHVTLHMAIYRCELFTICVIYIFLSIRAIYCVPFVVA